MQYVSSVWTLPIDTFSAYNRYLLCHYYIRLWNLKPTYCVILCTSTFSEFFGQKCPNFINPLITSSPAKLRFAQKCILGEWLYNVTKGIGRVCSVLKRSIGCWKMCGNDCLRWCVQSGYMVAEGGVKPLFAIICLMKWGELQLPILFPNILQC